MRNKVNVGAIMISCKILINNELPNWMYREEPIEYPDSGWRVFSGSEDEEYLENPSNFKVISTAQLIEIDSEIIVNLCAPIGWSFERNMASNEWLPVDKGDFTHN
ncbi:DUF2185 domain-containing protein [Pedobacter frigiditerrae]|uniref:immunity protein Imm33 domain-containing protein n=1 Tax=Pedobacter frigiditerrae TaxID=2530452 RepID=UPI002931A53A|nr:DUF2185 domain-containing protein [Pedobacter frigiditerrae]